MADKFGILAIEDSLTPAVFTTIYTTPALKCAVVELHISSTDDPVGKVSIEIGGTGDQFRVATDQSEDTDSGGRKFGPYTLGPTDIFRVDPSLAGASVTLMGHEFDHTDACGVLGSADLAINDLTVLYTVPASTEVVGTLYVNNHAGAGGRLIAQVTSAGTTAKLRDGFDTVSDETFILDGICLEATDVLEVEVDGLNFSAQFEGITRTV